jgi:chemotaxis protein CheD
MADIKTGKEPSFLSTILGSCVGVCLYVPQHQVGGLLHLMLASGNEYAGRPDFKKAKFADTGIVELIRQMRVNYGVQPSDMVAKVFGGAKVLSQVERNIGQENIEAVRSILRSAGIPVKAYKVGGEKGYRIKFHLDSGKVMCQVFGQEPEEF